MGSLNGGIIATILDCHSGAAVFLVSAQESESGIEFQPWVTSGLELRYRLPTFLDEPSILKASVVSREDGVMIVKATLSYAGKVRVQAESRWVCISRDELFG
jgi:acyl-coenzyme A thioesterase PaaI-like protein